jgi:hypothetical protein
VKLHDVLASAWPAESRIPPVKVTVYLVLAARSLVGLRVHRLVPLRVKDAETTGAVALAVALLTVKVARLTPVTDSLKVVETLAPRLTLVALAPGLLLLTVGA